MCVLISLFMAVKVKEPLCTTLSTIAFKSWKSFQENCCGTRNLNMAFTGHHRVAALSLSNQAKTPSVSQKEVSVNSPSSYLPVTWSHPNLWRSMYTRGVLTSRTANAMLRPTSNIQTDDYWQWWLCCWSSCKDGAWVAWRWSTDLYLEILVTSDYKIW